jgi:hypothetical protein
LPGASRVHLRPSLFLTLLFCRNDPLAYRLFK